MKNADNLSRQAETWFAVRQGFEALAEYLRYKRSGVKTAAREASERFAAGLDEADGARAQNLVRALHEGWCQFGELPGLVPYPVAMAASRLCRRWEALDPKAADPLVFRAGFEWNPDLYAEALERDPTHPAALRGRILDQLRRVSDAFHTIERGALSEAESEVRAAMVSIRTLCRRLADPRLTLQADQFLDLCATLLAGLDAWRAAGQAGDFAGYMKARGMELGTLAWVGR